MRADQQLKSWLLTRDGDWPAYLRYWIRVGSGATMPLAYRGSRYECPCCEGRFSRFCDFRASRSSRCPRCASLQRQRVLWLYLKQETDFLTRPVRILHVAPDFAFHRRMRHMPLITYVTADLQRSPMIRERVDITSMPFADGTFDLVLCSHVLEHVPDDRRALREFRRVLSSDGVALLQHPIANREATDEDPRVVDPDERLRRWGQSDHVRAYGRDYPQRVSDAGFDVEMRAYHEELPRDVSERCRLFADNPVFSGQDIAVCRVNAGTPR